MKYASLFLFFVITLATASPLRAQKSNTTAISLSVTETPFSQFISELEKQSGYRIFYDSTGLDSLKITLSASNENIEQVLKKVLTEEYQIAADQHKNLFITRGLVIKTQLPEGFLFPKLTVGNRLPADTILTSYEITKGKLPASTIQNKLFEIGDKQAPSSAATVNMAGLIRDAQTGEPIAGAYIYVEKPTKSVFSDQYGYYSIVLPKGRYTLQIQSLGMKDTHRQVMIYGDGKLDIDMNSEVMTLKNVIVTTQKSTNITNTQMGVQKINIQSIKQVPVAFGEADLLRVVLTLPGVKSVGEASTGLNVRGGSTDQNLILFNDATIYNPSHFFGMFSAFNPEVVKDLELYKSSIPARYGGRLSSVLEINGREGNKKQYTGSAGIGLLTSRLQVEGPLKKDKSSFITGVRTTYANWLMKLLPKEYENSKASFYDMNLHVSHEINKRNNIYLTGYLSNDAFNLNSKTVYQYGNKNLSVKWKHIFNNKLNGLLTSGYDRYNYNITNKEMPLAAYKQSFDINQQYFKSHFNYYPHAKHTIDFGLHSLLYKIHPGNYEPAGKESLTTPDELPAEQALETALYFSDRYTIYSNLSLEVGSRFSQFNYLGPQKINNYAPGLPKIENNIVDSVFHGRGKVIKRYQGPEFRISARFLFPDSSSVKAGYNTQRQYIHMISNTTTMSPTDIWKLSDPNIKPQYGDQVSIGYYKNFKSNTIETSLELYYKNIKDYLDYKSGASLIMNHHIETDVITSKGKAYGIELLVKKTSGKLNGWISYTYSRTLLQAADSTAGEVINGGNYYPANSDKPHDITAIGNYRFTHRYSVSLNGTYSTGRPITLPIGRFSYMGSARSYYTDRNAYRVPDYFRMDISVNIEGNHRLDQKTHNSWTFGIYNLTGRRNAYSVYYVSENSIINGYKLSIFGSAIPYVNYNIRF